MNLITMLDELLRDRQSLYWQLREQRTLKTLCLRLLGLFLITSAVYGAAMGAYRCFHPAFFFSDFELTTTKGTSVQGDVAGLMEEQQAFYTQQKLPPEAVGGTVRFNRTDPSETYHINAVSEEKGYTKIELAPDSVLMETGRWLLPFLVALKIPLLFLLTLFVCSLALYILNLAFGMKLHFMPSMALMLFALAGTGVMLLVFAPITMLFSVVTASYHFMKILHVIVFTIAGLFGVKILGEGLERMQAPVESEELHPSHTGNARLVLYSWLILYCLVGAQLAWTLKPFLGTPYLTATPPFRLERGNIFVSTMGSTESMGRGEARGEANTGE